MAIWPFHKFLGPISIFLTKFCDYFCWFFFALSLTMHSNTKHYYAIIFIYGLSENPWPMVSFQVHQNCRCNATLASLWLVTELNRKKNVESHIFKIMQVHSTHTQFIWYWWVHMNEQRITIYAFKIFHKKAQRNGIVSMCVRVCLWGTVNALDTFDSVLEEGRLKYFWNYDIPVKSDWVWLSISPIVGCQLTVISFFTKATLVKRPSQF